METWTERKPSNGTVETENSNNFGNILVTHDLQDCIDESLDFSLNKVYEQLSVINSARISDEKERQSNSTYIGKFQEGNENVG